MVGLMAAQPTGMKTEYRHREQKNALRVTAPTGGQ